MQEEAKERDILQGAEATSRGSMYRGMDRSTDRGRDRGQQQRVITRG
jgi:hypothetical protein